MPISNLNGCCNRWQDSLSLPNCPSMGKGKTILLKASGEMLNHKGVLVVQHTRVKRLPPPPQPTPNKFWFPALTNRRHPPHKNDSQEMFFVRQWLVFRIALICKGYYPVYLYLCECLHCSVVILKKTEALRNKICLYE